MAGIEEDEVPIRIPTRIVYSSNDVIHISREQMKANRRVLKRFNLLERIPRMTKDDPIHGRAKVRTLGGHAIAYTINGHAILAAEKRKEARRSKPVVMNPVAASSQPTAATTEAKEKEGSVPNKDVGESSEIVVETLNPGAADSSAINVASVGTKDEMEGGSALKRTCVNLCESSELVAGNLNPADPSAATGTSANVKGGSMLNKDPGK